MIYDNTLYYRSLRAMVTTIFGKFFKEVEVRGAENIPVGEPLLFAANHQSGLMDALAVLLYQKQPIVFMARADMFQNKILAKILRSLKIVPIYRIRDGYENLTKNEQHMNEAIDVLLAGKQLCLMPEGNLGDKHQLRPLVKGLFRIAFAAEERLENQAHVKIIPVGIDYDFYVHAGANLVVSYGKPIEVKDYIDIYNENKANGLNSLKDQLSDALSQLIHHVKSVDKYDPIYRLSCYGTPAYLENLLDKEVVTEATTLAGLRFDARCALSRVLDEMVTKHPDQLLELEALCQRINQLPGFPSEISEWLDGKRPRLLDGLLLLFSLPFLPGILMNTPAWCISKYIGSKGDKQMQTTLSLVLALLVNPMVYLVVCLFLFQFISVSWIEMISFYLLVSIYGLISERIRQALRMPLRQLAYSFGKRKSFLKACKKDFAEIQHKIGQFLKA